MLSSLCRNLGCRDTSFSATIVTGSPISDSVAHGVPGFRMAKSRVNTVSLRICSEPQQNNVIPGRIQSSSSSDHIINSGTLLKGETIVGSVCKKAAGRCSLN